LNLVTSSGIKKGETLLVLIWGESEAARK